MHLTPTTRYTVRPVPRPQVSTLLDLPHSRPDCAAHRFQRPGVGLAAAASAAKANTAHCPQVGLGWWAGLGTVREPERHKHGFGVCAVIAWQHSGPREGRLHRRRVPDLDAVNSLPCFHLPRSASATCATSRRRSAPTGGPVRRAGVRGGGSNAFPRGFTEAHQTQHIGRFANPSYHTVILVIPVIMHRPCRRQPRARPRR